MKFNMSMKTLMIMAAVVIPSVALCSQDLGEVSENLSDQMSILTNLIVMTSTFSGVLFMLIGGLGLKKYGDNPQQNPLTKPLVVCLAGTILFGLGATSDLMQNTIFGRTDARESGSGGQFEEFK